jgi:hypothetical protein
MHVGRGSRAPQAVFLLAWLAALAGTHLLAAETALPLAVHDGRCSCVIATPSSRSKFVLVVASLSRTPGPHRVIVRSEPGDGFEDVPLEVRATDPAWTQSTDLLRERLEHAWRTAESLDDYPPAAQPQRERTFALPVKDRDFLDPTGYVSVTGELCAVGRHCQVYVDRDWPDRSGLQATVADAVRTFDEEVYPQARERLGRVLDVDRDGRFTILFTGWLAKLCDGKVALGGFVRGSDFDRDLPGPLSNHCDMMYLNADLKPGPHLRSLLAHEYVHAVVFSEHIFGNYLPELPRQDEESWLNEGLAHLNEAAHAYSWSNLDYRIAAFLNAPERHALVVPDAHAAGLWRDPGHRGATFLFLRWCAEHYGPDLARRLVRSNLSGTTNLEVATRERFSELFRRWTTALACRDEQLPNMGRLLCGPRFLDVPLADGCCPLELTGTSAAYLSLHSPASKHTRLTITADADTELQVTLLPLPEDRARLSLRATPAGNGVRLSLTTHDAAVTLEDAAWERLSSATSRPEETSYRLDGAADATVRSWFGETTLHPGETRVSRDITVPVEAGPLVFKLVAQDAAGQSVTAWARCDQSLPVSRSEAPTNHYSFTTLPSSADFSAAASTATAVRASCGVTTVGFSPQATQSTK